MDKLLKDDEGNLRYICSDPSRQTFKFKTLGGEIMRDVKAKKLSKLLGSTVIPVTKEMIKEIIRDSNSDEFITISNNFMNIKNIDEDNGDFRMELANLTTRK